VEYRTERKAEEDMPRKPGTDPQQVTYDRRAEQDKDQTAFMLWPTAPDRGQLRGMRNHGEHLYRLMETFPGAPDTRFLRCIVCGFTWEGSLEDVQEPVCFDTDV
jgi:hypothetical protein